MWRPWYVVQRVCTTMKEKVNVPDQKRFDGDARKSAFGMKGGQRVIMMSLGAYSKTVWRRPLCCSRPQGHHYQLEVSRDLSTGQTQEVVSHTRRTCARLLAWMHTLASLPSSLMPTHTHTCARTCPETIICHVTQIDSLSGPWQQMGGLLLRKPAEFPDM